VSISCYCCCLFSSVELKRITEVFTRMFHDPHSKVFSTFIDTFIDLVTVHGCDVVDWFSICFSRLISKSGMDVLSALQSRIARALEAMRCDDCTVMPLL